MGSSYRTQGFSSSSIYPNSFYTGRSHVFLRDLFHRQMARLTTYLLSSREIDQLLLTIGPRST